MKVAIVTDSGCALTPQQGREKGIYVVPLQVIDENETFRDGVEMTTQQLYERLKANHTPKTSLPVPSDIKEMMQTIKADGYDEIIALPLSSGLSSTFNSIRMIAEDEALPITIIENYTTCDLQGHGALLAKALVEEGKNAQQVKTLLYSKIQTSGTLILPNDIQHLKRGGRLTPIAAAAASLLKIKPILKIDPSTEGKIDVFEKVRTEKKALQRAVAYVCEEMKDKEGYVFVIHSNNEAKAQEIREELQAKNPLLEIKLHTICAVIAAHTGLDCIAIQYIQK